MMEMMKKAYLIMGLILLGILVVVGIVGIVGMIKDVIGR